MCPNVSPGDTPLDSSCWRRDKFSSLNGATESGHPKLATSKIAPFNIQNLHRTYKIDYERNVYSNRFLMWSYFISIWFFHSNVISVPLSAAEQVHSVPNQGNQVGTFLDLCLSRKLNSNFADNKKFCIVFFFGGISFKDVVTRRENVFFASSVIFSFCIFLHDNNCVVNRKARTL